MKLLPVLLLALLFIAPSFAQTPPIEYNISVCGPKGIGIIHMMIASDKDDKETITFDYVATAPGVMEQDKDPIVFTTSEKAKLKGDDTITTRISDATFDKLSFSLISTYKEDRMMGIIAEDKDIIQYVYGTKGPLDKSFDDLDAAVAFCGQLRKAGPDALEGLEVWLMRGYPKVDLPTEPQK